MAVPPVYYILFHKNPLSFIHHRGIEYVKQSSHNTKPCLTFPMSLPQESVPPMIWVGMSHVFVELWVRKIPRRLIILLVDPEFILHCLVSSFWETKKARKAMPAVMMIPTSPDINNQYVSHKLSINWPRRTKPEARMMVTTIITAVRQRDNAKTIFWDHRILICQMICNGIARTNEQMSAFIHQIFCIWSYSLSP